MPNSMTGFGTAEGSVAGGRLRVEIRTVNHRYFNIAAKLPSPLSRCPPIRPEWQPLSRNGVPTSWRGP